MWTQTRAKIIEVINASATTIAEVFAYPTSSENKYPAVNVIGSDLESEFGTGAPANQNVHTAVFTIRILFTISDGTEETAEARIDSALDELSLLFSNPNALAPACDWVEPVSASWGFQDRANGQVRVADLKIRCNKLQ